LNMFSNVTARMSRVTMKMAIFRYMGTTYPHVSKNGG
jgi:hypothetical protein